ncbi:hypothetical protein ACFTSF_02875 [Kribbella sp. NPDC056951]|uniref:hypothetical protein n=1 Tax=Kribbella sp. NPDC056951 TaxID=3345978 RepID=UPI0036393CAD
MPKLTDDQLGDLLRETFADHESDSLPAATKRRRVAPILIAAAAVLAVVLGSVVYGVQRPDPAPPAATPTADTNADVWATAIRKIATAHQPAGGWRTLRIYTTLWRIQGTEAIPVEPNEPMPPSGSRMGFQVERAERDRIGRLVGDLAPVEWSDGIAAACPRDVAEITIGQIAHYPDYKLVNVHITYGCTSRDSILVQVN